MAETSRVKERKEAGGREGYRGRGRGSVGRGGRGSGERLGVERERVVERERFVEREWEWEGRWNGEGEEGTEMLE